ncbi:MAG: electron transfer flavoprotein subunit alpha/FixB family protein [Clostridiaceae bacterium]|jgi:electron transfer flavoprotein alpha subunit|nr:electron transfer flavoprotein subunit alpha/FixB family protein [Clostridiaceae bacterium]
MNKGILLYAEVNKSNYVQPVFFELASKAQKLAEKIDNCPVMALIITKEGNTQNFKEGFEKFGIDEVYVVEDDRLENYTTEFYSKVALDEIKKIKPAIILIGATTQGRDLAPRLASELHAGLTADCIELDINEKGQLAATRPTFDGQLMATILSKSDIQMATVRENVFKPMEHDTPKQTEYIYDKAEIYGLYERVKILNFAKGIEKERNKLLDAKIIISGGKGMKTAKGFELLKEFADTLGAEVGASRGATDIGIAPKNMQIGQTGITVSPKIYIACGISGAIQHIVGMENSDKIFAINIDENAPIFEHADYGIVGDVFEILPKLIGELK